MFALSLAAAPITNATKTIGDGPLPAHCSPEKLSELANNKAGLEHLICSSHLSSIDVHRSVHFTETRRPYGCRD